MTPQPQQEHVRWFGRSEDDPNRLLIIEDDHCRVFLDAELREELYAVIRSRPAPAVVPIPQHAINKFFNAIIKSECEEAAAQARDEIYKRLIALRTEAEGIDCVTIADIECLFAELRQEAQRCQRKT